MRQVGTRNTTVITGAIAVTLKLSEDLRAAIENTPGQPVRVEDDQTKKVYLLVEESEAPQLYEQWLRHELQKGFRQADRGETVDWHPERIKAEGRRRLAQQQAGADG